MSTVNIKEIKARFALPEDFDGEVHGICNGVGFGIFSDDEGEQRVADLSYKLAKNATYCRDHWKCRHCKTRNQLTPHHVQYQSHGGQDVVGNLLTLCIQCHDAIHAGHLHIFVGGVRMTGSNFEDINVNIQRLVFAAEIINGKRWQPQ